MTTANTNLEVKKEQQLTASALFNREDVKKKFEAMLGKKAQGFITSVLQCITSNKLLKNADPISVYNAAAVAATLDLPINQNLGFAYIIPYNEKYQDKDGQWQTRQVAQFQMGYKGFIQLAQRSGLYKTIAATPIYEGQLIESNPLTGFVFDFAKKSSDKITGYAAFFQLLNGFEKTMYATNEELQAHGKKYSQSFKKNYGLWVDNFDSMAIKTLLKLLISKYGPLSIEMQTAVTTDQAIINNETGDDVTYIDHEEVDQEENQANKEQERIILMISDCKTYAELSQLAKHITPETQQAYDNKAAEFSNNAINPNTQA